MAVAVGYLGKYEFTIREIYFAQCHNKRYKCVPLLRGEGLMPREKRVLVLRLQHLWYLDRKRSRKRDLTIALVILIFKSKCNIV